MQSGRQALVKVVLTVIFDLGKLYLIAWFRLVTLLRRGPLSIHVKGGETRKKGLENEREGKEERKKREPSALFSAVKYLSSPSVYLLRVRPANDTITHNRVRSDKPLRRVKVSNFKWCQQRLGAVKMNEK